MNRGSQRKFWKISLKLPPVPRGKDEISELLRTVNDFIPAYAVDLDWTCLPPLTTLPTLEIEMHHIGVK